MKVYCFVFSVSLLLYSAGKPGKLVLNGLQAFRLHNNWGAKVVIVKLNRKFEPSLAILGSFQNGN
jgi:hypothetical protein